MSTPPQPDSGGALSGLVVADFSRVLAGPYATMLLGDLGADVIKVERPGNGDDTRAWGPPYASDGQSTYFHSVNRNKRSLSLDLGEPRDLDRARDLIAGADVVVENFRPGTVERLGLGYEFASTVNPRVIYCSISGFGPGAGAALPGYDLLVQAMGGLMSITGPSPEQPTKVGVALVDVITGLHAVYGILAALRHRDMTGQGQLIEVNLLSSLLSGMVNQTAAFVGAGTVPQCLGNDHPSIAPYAVYKAADRSFVIAVGNDRQFENLVAELGCPKAATDPRFASNPARVEHRGELRDLLESKLQAATADEWRHRLVPLGIPCGPVNDIGAAFDLAASLGLDPIVHIASTSRKGSDSQTDSGGSGSREASGMHGASQDLATGVPQVANPVRLSATPATYRFRPPAPGGV